MSRKNNRNHGEQSPIFRAREISNYSWMIGLSQGLGTAFCIFAVKTGSWFWVFAALIAMSLAVVAKFFSPAILSNRFTFFVDERGFRLYPTTPEASRVARLLSRSYVKSIRLVDENTAYENVDFELHYTDFDQKENTRDTEA